MTPFRIVAPLLVAAIVALLPAVLHAHGTSHELIDAVTREIAARPDDAALYLRRAFLHLEHGDWHACLLDADEAERRQKEDIGVGLMRGRALAAGGRYAEAKVVLDGFVASHPGHPNALMERARVQAALGQPADAANDFVLAISHVARPEPDQVFELADFLQRAGRPNDALAAINTALKLTPGLPALLERAVQIEMECGRPDAALRRVDEAIRAAKIKEPLLAKRAALLARAGRIQDSTAAWKELQARIAAMPALERASHAMSRLLEQSRHAVESLASLPPP